MTDPPPPSGRGLARTRHHLVRLALLTLGWSMLGIGLVGGLLPFIQGWPFGVAGAVLLYVESRWFQRKVRRWRTAPPPRREGLAEAEELASRPEEAAPERPRPAQPPDDPG